MNAHLNACSKVAPRPKAHAKPLAPDDLFGRITNYWAGRSKAFGRIRKNELASDKQLLWREEILPYLPKPKGHTRLRVLDIGTGAGFFALLLAQETNCDVTGIDICPDMVREAKALAKACGSSCSFHCMDATALEFASESFDCVLVRNVTWTLLRPKDAYAEWLRVLRPEGVLLNFDANYGQVAFTDFAKEPGQHAHADLNWEELSEGECIRQRLPLSQKKRPAWDVAILHEIGFRRVVLDQSLSARVYAKRDAFYNPVPMFALRAIK